MAYDFQEKYFFDSLYTIKNNKYLREPQIEAYYKTLEYYSKNPQNRNSLIVLPTGVGKTGVIGIIPFGLCKKRTLIITPGTTIRDTIIESLDSSSPDNFWYKRNIIQRGLPLPNVIEYEGSYTNNEVLESANIVILNIQKLQSRYDSSLINRVNEDFFDLILIDEAHHSTATTWVECINHFRNAKIIKLTGTPFRTDGEQLVGELIYKYPLSRAMYNGYVKSLSNIKYTPDQLMLTIDNNTEKLYTVDQILDLGLRDKDWITRSVAYSESCSQSIVDESIAALNTKKINSNIPHKIIAIACSIEHAKQIEILYKNKGLRTTLVHSDLQPYEKTKAFSDIDNHRVDVVINVAMLGEGYDHPYLTIAAIFRPFRSELPYTQFIGRVLRYIPEGSANDNVAIIISHKHLYLDKLWEKYKKEIQESEIIKALKDFEDELDGSLDIDDDDSIPTGNRDLEILGNVHQSQSHKLLRDDYLDTELIKKSQEEEIKMKEQIKQLQEILSISEDQAKLILTQRNANSSNTLGRPDLLYKRRRKNLDSTIREEIVPHLIEKNNVDKDDNDLMNCGLFTGSYWNIPNRISAKSKGKNAAMLALYINTYLRKKIGAPRADWSEDDYGTAFDLLDNLKEHIDSLIKRYYNQ